MDLSQETYKALEPRFSSLDLLFFRGPGIPSKVIQYAQEIILGDGTFSHCGLLISKDVFPNLSFLEDGEWYVWESTMFQRTGVSDSMSIPIPYVQTDDVVNEETKKGKLGVQIRKLRDVVNKYTSCEMYENDALIAWGPLKTELKENLSQEFIQEKLNEVYQLTKDLYYEKDMIELSMSIFTPIRKLIAALKRLLKCRTHRCSSSSKSSSLLDTTVDDSYFCSELVAYVYQLIGILPEDLKPETVVPMDFLGYEQDGIVPNCTEHLPIQILPS